jgi:hypothetical protein
MFSILYSLLSIIRYQANRSESKSDTPNIPICESVYKKFASICFKISYCIIL